MISQHDIDAFAEDLPQQEPVKETEWTPSPNEAYVQVVAYSLWVLGWRSTASCLLKAAGFKVPE